jgi:EAL domain-containing protein (putative c-di-GMP-specific phosphodiesterase class I)
MGLPVALDDFGTGYSNLSYIQRFPITTLKIDKSFVQKIETSNNSRALVSGIISMARALQLEVVAEGVETAAQLKFLLLQQCDAMQGYLASPAVPGAEFRDRFLREERQVNILDTFGDGN